MAFIDVIKYEGGNNVLVWKHPREDFNTAAQLIVHESQEAIVFKDGEASEPYTKGKYTIESDNIPGVRRVVGLVTGGISPNHCEVYFVNKAYSMPIYWGTSTPWTIQDPSLQIEFHMKAHGQFSVRVFDSKLLVTKLVGTTTSFTNSQIEKYFRGIVISHIKSQVSSVMHQNGISYAQINSHLTSLSDRISPIVSDLLKKYGLSLESFAIESIEKNEDEISAEVRKTELERFKQVALGFNTQEQWGYDVAKAQAQNPGTSGQMGQMMTGIAAGAAVAPAIGGIMRSVVNPINGNTNISSSSRSDQFSMGVVRPQPEEAVSENEVVCPSCGAKQQAGSRFCNQCGASMVPVATEELTCPVCGAKLPPNSKFCNSCGAKL